MKTNISRAILCVMGVAAFLLCVQGAAQAGTMVYGRARAIAKDGTGRVWALARPEENGHERLCVWDGDSGWRRVDFVPGEKDQGINFGPLETDEEGWVRCTWHEHPDHTYVTRHRGDESEVLAHIQAPRRKFREVVVDAEGRAWASGPRVVYRTQEDGSLEIAQRFATDDYHPRESVAPDADYETPRMFADIKRGVWAWGKNWPGVWGDLTLRGLCRFVGDKVEHHPTIRGVPDKPFIDIAHKYGSTYYVAVKGEGLYEVNVRAVKGKKVAEPEPGAFRHVYAFHRVDGELYVSAARSWLSFDWARNKVDVWRLDGDACVRVIGGLREDWERPLVKTANGLWLGTEQDGLFYVPEGEREGIQVDWRRGFGLRRVESMVELDDGRLMLCQRYGEDPTVVVEIPEELLVEPNPAPNLDVIRAAMALVQGEDKRLWTILRESPGALSVWNGERWDEYPLPETCPRDEESGEVARPRDVNMDSFGRVWVSFYRIEQGYRFPDADGFTAVFDPAGSSWLCYETFLNALEAQRERGDAFAFTSQQRWEPLFHESGRMAFQSREPWKVYYLGKVSDEAKANLATKGERHRPSWRAHPGPDGLEWFGFLYNDVGNGEIAQVYFTDDGRLAVNTRPRGYGRGSTKDETWELDEQKGWEKVEHRPRPDEDWVRLRTIRDLFDNPRPSSALAVVEDERGTYWHWFAKDGRLYKQGMGQTAAQFLPGERHPCLDRQAVREVRLDPKGNVVISLGYWGEYMLLRPREPMPKTELEVAFDEADAVTVHMKSASGGEPWYVWRLDEDTWSEPSQATAVSLADLPAGEHRFEAYAVDERLQVEEPAQVARIDVKVDGAEQTAKWIAQLGSEDYDEREAAVKALLRAGKAVVPALKDARVDADEGMKWWIDVTLERIGE